MHIDNTLYLEEHLSDKRLAEKLDYIESFIIVLFLTVDQRRYGSPSPPTILLRILVRVVLYIITTSPARATRRTSSWMER